MINLAKREATVIVDLEDDAAPGLSIEMKALTDEEAASVISGRIRSKMDEKAAAGEMPEAKDVAVEMPYGQMLDLFQAKFYRFVGDEVRVEGEPFNAADPSHIATLPLHWKLAAMGRLITYAMALTEAEVGNSVAQALDSPEDTMSSDPATV